jgi:glycosyltransferase involved in cell wall biosynthesis
MAHNEKEIVEVEGCKESSIFKHSHGKVESQKNTGELQNHYVKCAMPWVTHEFGALSVLLVGRFETYSKGGIYKSCHLIKHSLEKLGHRVVVADTTQEFSREVFNGNFDICWIYPGDPIRPDFEHVDSKVQDLKEMEIPVLVNLSYLSSKNRTSWIADKIKEYNKGLGSPVMAAVFTETAANDPLLNDIRDYVCVVPKTIDPTPARIRPSFSQREGICLGDATKLSNPDIIGGNVRPWIDAISNRLPGVNLYAYKQYEGKNPHPKIQYIPHMKDDFGDFLAARRLFICLNVYLTFEMVSCEAQSYGTPVIYRHMPHSLSEYISATGMAVRTPEEMAEMVAWLYNNEDAWNSISDASYFNAKSKNISCLQYSLEGYLRLAVLRAKERRIN